MSEQHKIVIRGSAVGDDRISGHVFRDLLDVLVEGSERALRFYIDGRSTARGTQPGWIRSAADFQLVRGVEGDAGTAIVEARPLIETMPERFQQSELFSDVDPALSPIELFENALEDALAGNEDSDRFDLALLKTIEKLEGLIAHGVDQVELVNGRTIKVDRAALAQAHRVSQKAFAPQRVKVAGRLEAIRYSGCRFTLVTADGVQLSGVAVDLGPEALSNHFGEEVVVTGTAVFRASGFPLRIEAARIQRASAEQISLWSAVPKPLLAPKSRAAASSAQRAKGGLAAVFGKWPGDESDEEIAAALAALS
ncbi:MAG: hypothetical protein RMA76_32510 [Deltaproteobacteria bacterium]|jgi:hypothetical protein